MLRNRKHVFYQNVPALGYMALGDTSVRVIALTEIIRQYDLDARIVPQGNATMRLLWEKVFGAALVNTVPPEFADACISRPNGSDHGYGQAAFDVFESVWWENGFFDTHRLRITPPQIFKCAPGAKAAMIYPKEKTDANRVYTAARWQHMIDTLRRKDYKINCLGDTMELLVDQTFPATIEGLTQCVAASSLAIGANTGPTWACLMSDIPQIVLESKKSPHGYWNFDRCQRVLTKRLQIVTELEACL
jgi:hypothetical protein